MPDLIGSDLGELALFIALGVFAVIGLWVVAQKTVDGIVDMASKPHEADDWRYEDEL